MQPTNASVYDWLWKHKIQPQRFSFLLPDTVVFKEGIPLCWYFSNEVRQVKKKIKEVTTIESIKNHFLKIAKKGQQVIAQFYSQQSTTITYLDCQSFGIFLQSEILDKDGVLQAFIDPPTHRNCVIRAAWDPPNQVQIMKILNKHDIGDASVDIRQRSCTFDGNSRYIELDNLPGKINSSIKQCLFEIVSHLGSFIESRLVQMRISCFFKQDTHNNIYFIFTDLLNIPSIKSSSISNSQHSTNRIQSQQYSTFQKTNGLQDLSVTQQKMQYEKNKKKRSVSVNAHVQQVNDSDQVETNNSEIKSQNKSKNKFIKSNNNIQLKEEPNDMNNSDEQENYLQGEKQYRFSNIELKARSKTLTNFNTKLKGKDELIRKENNSISYNNYYDEQKQNNDVSSNKCFQKNMLIRNRTNSLSSQQEQQLKYKILPYSKQLSTIQVMQSSNSNNIPNSNKAYLFEDITDNITNNSLANQDEYNHLHFISAKSQHFSSSLNDQLDSQSTKQQQSHLQQQLNQKSSMNSNEEFSQKKIRTIPLHPNSSFITKFKNNLIQNSSSNSQRNQDRPPSSVYASQNANIITSKRDSLNSLLPSTNKVDEMITTQNNQSVLSTRYNNDELNTQFYIQQRQHFKSNQSANFLQIQSNFLQQSNSNRDIFPHSLQVSLTQDKIKQFNTSYQQTTSSNVGENQQYSSLTNSKKINNDLLEISKSMGDPSKLTNNQANSHPKFEISNHIQNKRMVVKCNSREQNQILEGGIKPNVNHLLKKRERKILRNNTSQDINQILHQPNQRSDSQTVITSINKGIIEEPQN